MTKIIGRKFSIGLAKEATRGTAVAAAFWIPKTDLTIDDKINIVTDDSSIGVIEDAIGQDVTQTYSEGTISGLVYQTSFGLILLGTFGTETSSTQVSGDTTVYDHLFNVGESAQHKSLTVSVADPNSANGLQYTLGMIDQLDIDFEVGKYFTHKTAFRANSNATSTNTTSFTAENKFKPQDGNVYFASSLSGLSSATAINVRKGTLTIKKNIEDDMTIGNIAAVDRLNKSFSCEGTLELVYNDRTQIDTNLIPGISQAMRIQFVNTNVTIGSTSHPTVTFDLAKITYSEVSRTMTNNDIMLQTIKFKAFYSISDSTMIKATLRNLQVAVY